eukprot:Lankesteria_metandrocarpae@DN630_c0_g1_i1.p1
MMNGPMQQHTAYTTYNTAAASGGGGGGRISNSYAQYYQRQLDGGGGVLSPIIKPSAPTGGDGVHPKNPRDEYGRPVWMPVAADLSGGQVLPFGGSKTLTRLVLKQQALLVDLQSVEPISTSCPTAQEMQYFNTVRSKLRDLEAVEHKLSYFMPRHAALPGASTQPTGKLNSWHYDRQDDGVDNNRRTVAYRAVTEESCGGRTTGGSSQDLRYHNDTELYDREHYNTEQYDREHYNTEQYDTGKYDTEHYTTGQYDTEHYTTGQYDTEHYTTGQYDTEHCNMHSCPPVGPPQCNYYWGPAVSSTVQPPTMPPSFDRCYY